MIIIIMAILVIMAIILYTSTTNEHFEQNIDHNMISQRSDLMRVFEDGFNRKEFNIPNVMVDGIPHKILKGDFHMHTIYSDGHLHPYDRVIESWMHGLDVIAITDHIDFFPHKDVKNSDLNTSYDKALSISKALGMTLIKGGELTKSEPIGHYNFLFLDDVNSVKGKTWIETLNNAKDQGAVIIWNHPGWAYLKSEKTPVKNSINKKLLKSGLLDGIEIANCKEYYPEAFSWASDNDLTIFGNSDAHLHRRYYLDKIPPPMTLVFTRGNDISSIKYALVNNMTIVHNRGSLFGKEHLLNSLFNACVEILDKKIVTNSNNEKKIYVRILNKSDFKFEFYQLSDDDDIYYRNNFTLYPRDIKVAMFTFGANINYDLERDIEIDYEIRNIYIDPNTNLQTKIKFKWINKIGLN